MDYVRTLIQQEVEAGIPLNRIVIGGFSQARAALLLAGGAMHGINGWREKALGVRLLDSGAHWHPRPPPAWSRAAMWRTRWR